jgi:glutamate--cysteine ligase
MASTPIDFTSIFSGTPKSPGLIGIEVECGLVDPESGMSISYNGPRGAAELLKTILSDAGGSAIVEGRNILAVKLPDGAEISLEMGGALEYSSVPQSSVNSLVATAARAIEQIAAIAQRLGIAVLSGSMLPFTAIDRVPWIPKRRVQIMRDYFATLGDDGSLADGVMGLTLSTQVTFDYESPLDLAEKLRMQVGISPIVAALCVNSPIENGNITGALSRRMQFWKKIDPPRCGILPYAVGRNPQVQDIIDWVCGLPMIYRPVGDTHQSVPSVPFRDLLARGFGDGTYVTSRDWQCQLNQAWPNVRVRRTLETRIADGLPWPHFGAAAALWTGLTYHRPSLQGALHLISNLTIDELQQAADDATVKGISAYLGQNSMQDLGRELINLATQGLKERIAIGIEPSNVLELLRPLTDVAVSGSTFAERNLRMWANSVQVSPQLYVDHFRVSSGQYHQVYGRL